MKTQVSEKFTIISLFALHLLLAGCGGGDNQEGPPSANAPTAAGSATEPAAAPSGPTAGPVDLCPLTAAEVSHVLGVPVQQAEGVCMFEPEPGINPTVLYVRQVSFACSDAVVNDPDFGMGPFEGLGIKAYLSAAGNDLLVCTNPPFEISVDITPALDGLVADTEAASAAARDSERSAVEQLARLILAR